MMKGTKALALNITLLLTILLSACSSSVRFTSVRSLTPPDGQSNIINQVTNPNLSPVRSELVRFAGTFLGTPYCYGGSGLPCLDCSGFVGIVFKHVGVTLPRTAEDIASIAQKDRCVLEKAQPGDLIFFSPRHAGGVSHIGIVLSPTTFIHASTSRGVVIDQLDKKPFADDLIFTASLLDNE